MFQHLHLEREIKIQKILFKQQNIRQLANTNRRTPNKPRRLL
jgi:hypothetical protein